MGEAVVIIIVLAIIGGLIALIAWLAFISSAVTIIFTEFVMRLPLIVSLIMFVLFPPTLIVFLVGFFMIEAGIAERIANKIKDK